MTPIQQALEALKPLADAADSEVWLDARFTKDKCEAARAAYEALSAYQDGWLLFAYVACCISLTMILSVVFKNRYGMPG